jgi:hypothetical protein
VRCPRFDLLGGPALLVALALSSTAARADATKEACVHSYEEAQRLRLSGDLLASRGELAVCSREACPDLVRKDCVTWIREVEGAIASVIVTARTPDDADQPDVRVFVDGVLAQPRLTGTALEVNPGQRMFRFEPPGAPPIEMPVLIATGEKNRPLRVAIPGEKRSISSTRAPLPGLSIALGAFGIASVGTGVALDLVGSASLRDLHSGCAPHCAPADVDATRARIIVGDTLLGVGIVSIGVAAIYWLTRPVPGSPSLAQVLTAPPRAPFVVTF